MTFDPFVHAGPRWFSIAAHRPFLGDLARGVLDWLGDAAPETLSDAVILLPNRRAARAFTAALSETAGARPVLLPQVRPLGDLEEDEAPFAPGEIEAGLPPAIGAMARRFELAALVRKHSETPMTPLLALEMGEALGRFLDSCAIEAVEAEARIKDLVEADFAEHWRASARLLEGALADWRVRLETLGLMDTSARRVALLNRLAESWEARPPTGPVIAAGSTGTVPAAARVLGAVADAPRGCVVLPGLDLDLADAAWDKVDHQHPQGAMKRLIARHGVDRATVRAWPAPEDAAGAARGRARRRLIAEALKPPEATADWLSAIRTMKADADDPLARGLDGLSLVVGRTEEATAARVAVMLRETLETPGKTAALVTPDQNLARRVQARLARWGLAADSSAGEPLARTRTGDLIGLLARLASEGVSAVALLSVLKHPFIALYTDDDAHRALRDLETHGLRGPAPADWGAIWRQLDAAEAPRDDGKARSESVIEAVAHARGLLAVLETRLSPLMDGAARDASDWARLTVETFEALAGGPDAAWRGAEGEAAARLMAQLIAEGAAAGPLEPAVWARMLDRMLATEVVRTGGDTHPGLRILGAIEARLARADRVILAGLEEGVWPTGAGADPFLSRPMREALGLPSPERRIGLQAHDFAQAATAPEVVLVHTERRGGQPSVKSRWLWRLETLLSGAGLAVPVLAGVGDWAEALDGAPPVRPDSLKPAPRPMPTPPVEARPREMSVTRVEEWVRDPYATYARAILKLVQMARPDERVDARIRGTAIHKAIERFSEAWETEGARGGVERFADIYLDELEKAGMPAAAMARERPLARGAGRFIVDLETERRAGRPRVFAERGADWTFEIDGRPFTLRAKADRLEVRDGRLSVIDFKTGGAPTKKQVALGFASQLPLTAAMASKGAFADLGAPVPDELLYVAVTGRETQKAPVEVSGDEGAAALAERALDGLMRQVARFDSEGTPYGSRTAPQFAQKAVSDYDHLARVREWSTAGEGEGE